MPRNLHFFINKKLGLIIILFRELVQATFGNGKDNELHGIQGNLDISNVSPNTQQSINDIATLDVSYLSFCNSRFY
jgi:hypothetical protein